MLDHSLRSVFIYCGTEIFDTKKSNEVSLGIVTIGKCISDHHPNIQAIVSGVAPKDFIGLLEA